MSDQLPTTDYRLPITDMRKHHSTREPSVRRLQRMSEQQGALA